MVVARNTPSETHLLVLQPEEQDLLHDGESRGLAAEARVLVLTLEVTGIIGYLAAALKGGASVERGRLEGL